MSSKDIPIFKVDICCRGTHIIRAYGFVEFEHAVIKITGGDRDYHYEFYDGCSWIRVTSQSDWKLAKNIFQTLKKKNEFEMVHMRVIPRCPFINFVSSIYQPRKTPKMIEENEENDKYETDEESSC